MPEAAPRPAGGVAARDRLHGTRVPTALLGLLVAALTFPVAFGVPQVGLDPSWAGGLYMAVDDGLSFGTEIVYTFGPLGFLSGPVLWVDHLAVMAFVWASLLWVAYASALVWAIRRNLGAIAAFVIAFVALALFVAAELALVLAVVAAFAVLQPERPRYALEVLIVGGGLFAAVEILVKLSIGPIIITVIVLALIGARARPLQIAAFAAAFALATVVLWLATGNDLGALPDYVGNGREVISGYSEAMGVDALQGIDKAVLYASPILLTAFAAFASYRDSRARICGTLLMAIAAFAIYKEGIVRADDGHATVAMATMISLWLAIPWFTRPLGRVVALGGTVAVLAAAVGVQGSIATARLDPISNVNLAGSQVETLFSPQKREDIAAFADAFMREAYDLDPETLAELEGRTVAVEPWESAVVWAYDLDWAPVPIFQPYSAYTSKLDEINAASIASADGPERILRQNPDGFLTYGKGRGLDQRYSAWDPPGQALATLCNFEPLHTTDSWQVLGRVPDRCGAPELIGSVDAADGETVDVPQAERDEVVFARIEGAEVSGFERIRTLLQRARFRYALIDEDEAYRFVPATAADGLLLDGSPKVTGSGPWEQAPRASTIALVGTDGVLRYDFYSMAVEKTTKSPTGFPAEES